MVLLIRRNSGKIHFNQGVLFILQQLYEPQYLFRQQSYILSIICQFLSR